MRFFLIGFLGVWLPGPDMLLVFRNSYLYGKLRAVITLLGILTGNIIYLIPVFFGFVFLIKTFFPFLLIVGSMYLFYIGIYQFFSKMKIELKKNKENLKKFHQFYFMGLLTNLSNPKAMIYFATVLLPSIKNRENILIDFIIFFTGVIFAFLSIIFLAQYLSNFLSKNGIIKMMNSFISLFFIIYSLYLFWEGIQLLSPIISAKRFFT